MDRDLTESDRAAWASFTRLIEPLSGRVHPEPSAGADALGPSRKVSAAVAAPRGRVVLPTVSIGVHPAGVDSSTWQRFRTGKLAAARQLDLHGHTAQHAYHTLTGFLRMAHADRVRCVEIITGRGSLEGGVLRRELPLWLNLPDIRPLVLAAAHPHAANPGAVRLLLRRVR